MKRPELVALALPFLLAPAALTGAPEAASPDLDRVASYLEGAGGAELGQPLQSPDDDRAGKKKKKKKGDKKKRGKKGKKKRGKKGQKKKGGI